MHLKKPEGVLTMMTLEQRFDTIVVHAWEAWTKNGFGLDDEAREETTKTVRDAVNNEYCDDLTDSEWLAATLKRLGVK
jgi:hypothetical protein